MKRSVSSVTSGIFCLLIFSAIILPVAAQSGTHQFNDWYTGKHLDRISFPIGGIGAGMFCLDGTGSISHLSVNHHPGMFNEPVCFAAISVKGFEYGAKVLEYRVPEWKYYGRPGTGTGSPGKLYGLPRFESARFLARFPFAKILLEDKDLPLSVELTGWSPFIPGDEDNSSLPAGAFEYKFRNNSDKVAEAVFSWNSRNILVDWAGPISGTKGGFIMSDNSTGQKRTGETGFAVYTDDPSAVVDHCWFRGDWFDPYMMLWKNIENQTMPSNPAREEPVMGASVYVPFTLNPGEEKIIRLHFCWYIPDSNLSIGNIPGTDKKLPPYEAWYTSKFRSIGDLIQYWNSNYEILKSNSELFSNSVYSSTLPQEVIEAVTANLTILKSPTLLRQADGRLWAWEGCDDRDGSCPGTCTHVWNYAQAIPHLFPGLERTLRETEFNVSQNNEGHQNFRVNLPISQPPHDFHAAADGQLGGIMKIYRDWRISGNTMWMKSLYPKVKQSLDYCISTWDPDHKGYLEEPHHNTYDIEFWGANGMTTSFYLGALKAFIDMSKALDKPSGEYADLLKKGIEFTDSQLFEGEYFIQRVRWEGLHSPSPLEIAKKSLRTNYSPEAIELLNKEGPKYQYGKGCLSDGILGMWLSRVCGIDQVLDDSKITSHLNAVYKYNLKHDLSDHVNPQRPAYAASGEGGLLLCTWPGGGKLSLPFVYSNEVWTGIEYQVASHLFFQGEIEKGLDIVRTTRNRYNGLIRNPFNEIECGSWYARALSSYALLEGLTGLRYDAVDKTLFIDSKIGNFKSFLSTATGFGTVELKDGSPSVNIVKGNVIIKKIVISGKEYKDQLQ
ncbi:MAG TPA: GH116 family glycosyl hydrolase [Bacteroidales bacterium]|nr:GH116 family glycosyl hydrolase [Bacteroidales bacterium]